MKQLSLLPGEDDAPEPTPEPEPAPTPVTPRIRAVRAELCVSLAERGVRMSLASTGRRGIRNLGTATLEVTPPVRVESTFGDGLLPEHRDGGVDAGGAFFRLPVSLAEEVIHGLPGADSQLAAMERDLGRAAAHLQGLLVPRGVRAARAFVETATWWDIYKVATDDATGRLGQLAGACPGLLLFLLALPGKVARPVTDGVIAGRRLNRLLGEAAEAWMRWYVDAGPAARCRHWPPEDDRRRMVTDQRVRVRRAGPLVPREVLLTPPPPVLVPEDIPRDPGQNRDWYVVTSVWGLPWTDWWRWGNMLSYQRDGLSRFLSRQWKGLCEHGQLSPADRPLEVMQYVGHVADYVRHTDRELDRGVGARRLVRELQDWEASRYQNNMYPPRTELQTHGMADWREAGDTIRPLATVGELLEESRAMKHCVASMARLGVQGQAVFLHGEIQGRPVTIEVAQFGAGFRQVDVRGRRNRLLTDEEQEVIRRWLREVNAGEGKRPTAWEEGDDVPF